MTIPHAAADEYPIKRPFVLCRVVQRPQCVQDDPDHFDVPANRGGADRVLEYAFKVAPSTMPGLTEPHILEEPLDVILLAQPDHSYLNVCLQVLVHGEGVVVL